ncbi:MAG: hypothetical protein ACI88G_001901 [Woeseiaceae bacterium]|jgi:hypothetical protein
MKALSNVLLILSVAVLASCGGSGSDDSIAPPATGTVTVFLTDGPMDEAQSLVFHVIHVDMGHADGSITHVVLPGGPLDIDMMQLQNGAVQSILNNMTIPAGQYEWMELGVDLTQSHIGTMSGGQHNMTMSTAYPFRGTEPFEIGLAQHAEFVMDFDLRRGVQQHDMGGMMGVEYRLHDAMRLMNTDNTGGVSGTVDVSLMDFNQARCDSATGGNWMYVYAGTDAPADDLAATDTDGFPGPIATDMVEMNNGTGEYEYHFAFLNAGSYRVAFTCSGEWDEDSDDDYPTDPDGMFDFLTMSAAMTVTAGQMHRYNVTP